MTRNVKVRSFSKNVLSLPYPREIFNNFPQVLLDMGSFLFITLPRTSSQSLASWFLPHLQNPDRYMIFSKNLIKGKTDTVAKF